MKNLFISDEKGYGFFISDSYQGLTYYNINLY